MFIISSWTGRQGYYIEINNEKRLVVDSWIKGTDFGHLCRSSLCRDAVQAVNMVGSYGGHFLHTLLTSILESPEEGKAYAISLSLMG